MRVAFTGGRAFRDSARVRDAIMNLTEEATTAAGLRLQVIVGDAAGADYLVRRWCQALRIPHRVYEARWAEYGRAAGPLRNQQMVEAGPDLVVAFPGGAGTADMVRRAEAAGIPVRMA